MTETTRQPGGSLSDRQRAIVDAVDGDAARVVSLLSDLVRIPSVNPVWPDSRPRGEQELQEYLAARLARSGFETDLFEPDVERLARHRGRPGHQDGRVFDDRPDLCATLTGRGDAPSLMLASHIDVVGVSEDEEWSVDPFGGEERDGYVWGRGSADMKGGAACQLAAVEILLGLGLRPGGDVVWASVVDEETGGMGTLAVVDRGYTAAAAFMPEPTSRRIVPMCRGILWGEIVVPGRSSHIEIPQADWRAGGAVDAIAKGRLVLEAFDRLNAEWARRPEKQHPLLPVPNQVYVSMFEAGQHPAPGPSRRSSPSTSNTRRTSATRTASAASSRRRSSGAWSVSRRATHGWQGTRRS